MNIIIFIIILLVLVLIHESGHFLTAKFFGIRVDEFGFGFPPKLFGWTYGETEYTLNLLPIGGFVKIWGENPDEENVTTGLDADRSLVNKPKWQQAIVLFAGVFANLLFAWFLFSFGLIFGAAKLHFFPALWEGIKFTLLMTKEIAIGFYSLIVDSLHGKGSLESITGPIGMVKIVGDVYKFGFIYLISFTGLISINLAFINLLPFPALDGGRLFFLLIEKIKGSRINSKFANNANMVGFAVLILLMLVVTYHDVVKLF